jgi:hypothetical protein
MTSSLSINTFFHTPGGREIKPKLFMSQDIPKQFINEESAKTQEILAEALQGALTASAALVAVLGAIFGKQVIGRIWSYFCTL